MRATGFAFFGAVVVVVGMAHCRPKSGGTDGDSAAASGSASAPAAPGMFTITAFCSGAYAGISELAKKCSDADKADPWFQLTTSFNSLASLACMTDIDKSVEMGRMTYDAAAGAKCIAAVKAHPVTEIAKAVAPDKLAECASVFAGKQDVDQPCKMAANCKTGLTCVGVTGGMFDSWDERKDGKCQKPAAKGGTCDHTFAGMSGAHPECGEDLHCKEEKCTPKLAAGAKCYEDICVKGHRCLGSKCVPGAEDAPPADKGGACRVEQHCKASLYCKDDKCAAKKPTGEKCIIDDECAGRCDSPDGGGQGKCVSSCGIP